MTYSAKIIKGGKIVIPAELRRELGFADGDRLVFEREGESLVIKSYSQVVREVQEAFRPFKPQDGSSVVDAFIAERRKEAQREEERSAATTVRGARA
ncbi:AbrB family looped-hinge helix DNA binding protein [Blastomonas natatoria]|uniref:AbrB family looped-hinge helix DNA binding protein n=1 Tax=Blastomonas natatoria TaxID=34015 RepID=A0A2V3VGJ6_9SPHN|nr:AbrB/MazE/SpoVT family DNA-binding domain-containing protein [Blastomonas natatoria]PXW79155.1 AbrB family looped-hinge helix DNA binding protein [Blastomonas natatoria]